MNWLLVASKLEVTKYYWEAYTEKSTKHIYIHTQKYKLPVTGGTTPEKRTVACSPLTSTLRPMTSNVKVSFIIK